MASWVTTIFLRTSKRQIVNNSARHGLKPWISIDNETRMPTDLFTQMRALLMSDRMQEIARAGKEGSKPTIVSVRELIEFATLQGAKTLGLEGKAVSLTHRVYILRQIGVRPFHPFVERREVDTDQLTVALLDLSTDQHSVSPRAELANVEQ